MLTKKQIEFALLARFPFSAKLSVEQLIPFFSSQTQWYFSFYLRELITNGNYSFVCSFDVQLDDYTLIVIDFSSAPFKISLLYSIPEIVEKVDYIVQKSAYVRKKIISSPLNIDML